MGACQCPVLACVSSGRRRAARCVVHLAESEYTGSLCFWASDASSHCCSSHQGFELVVLVVASYFLRLKPTPQPKVCPHIYDHVGLIIPCHKSANVIHGTLIRALRHFKAENIVVMDNGKSDTPLDDCLTTVRGISDRIMYRWVPIGNKAISLLLGSRLLPQDVTHILLMDDDVLIPETFEIDTSYFEDDDQVSAVAYSIGGCGQDNTSESMNIIQRFQDLEFKLWDTKRVFFGQYTSIIFAHGAVGLWRRDRFTEIYENHPVRSFAFFEDYTTRLHCLTSCVRLGSSAGIANRRRRMGWQTKPFARPLHETG